MIEFESKIRCRKTGENFSIAAGISLLLSLFFSIVISFVFRGNSEFQSSNIYRIFSFSLGGVFVFLVNIICGKKDKQNYFELLIPSKEIKLKYVIATILITIGFLFGLSEVNNWFVSFLESLGLSVSETVLPDFSVINFIVVVIFVCILPAIMEEILFRGIILRGFKGFKPIIAIAMTGFLFSLFHMNPAQTVYQFLVGSLYALIVLKTGNVWFTIISHFVNNLFIILNNYFFNITFEGVSLYIVTIVGLVSLVAGVLLLIFDKKWESSRDSTKKDFLAFLLSASIGIGICIIMWIARLI